MSKVFRVSVVWQMMGRYTIEAETEEEAKAKAFDADRPLPENGAYLEDSIEIDDCEKMGDGETEHEPDARD